MKRRCLIFVGSVLILANQSIADINRQESAYAVEVTKITMVFEQPSLTSTSIEGVFAGEIMYAIGVEDAWHKIIIASGKVRYIQSDCIRVLAEPPELTASDIAIGLIKNDLQRVREEAARMADQDAASILQDRKALQICRTWTFFQPYHLSLYRSDEYDPSAGETVPEHENMYVSTQTANVRSQPSSDGEILGQLKYRDLITIIAQQGSWRRIKFQESSDAWIHVSLLYPWYPRRMTDEQRETYEMLKRDQVKAYTVGEMKWKVESAYQAPSLRYRLLDRVVRPQGQFLVVSVIAENVGSRMKSLAGLNVIDTNGHEYTLSTESFFDDQLLSSKNLNPSVPFTFTGVYEIPRDAIGLQVVVGDLPPRESAERRVDLMPYIWHSEDLSGK